jgi:long-chain acyl-CoA synthetase
VKQQAHEMDSPLVLCHDSQYSRGGRERTPKSQYQMKSWFVAAALMLMCGAASPAEVAGVQIDDRVRVGTDVLVLNGAGLRTVLSFVSVYVGALYLPQRSNDGDAIIRAQAPRRLLMVMKHDVEAGKMLKAFHEGVGTHFSDAELESARVELDQLDKILQSIDKVRDGDRLSLDFGADESIRIVLNDEPRGAIQGTKLAPMLLSIWLGEHPVQEDLRRALLGL